MVPKHFTTFQIISFTSIFCLSLTSFLLPNHGHTWTQKERKKLSSETCLWPSNFFSSYVTKFFEIPAGGSLSNTIRQFELIGFLILPQLVERWIKFNYQFAIMNAYLLDDNKKRVTTVVLAPFDEMTTKTYVMSLTLTFAFSLEQSFTLSYVDKLDVWILISSHWQLRQSSSNEQKLHKDFKLPPWPIKNVNVRRTWCINFLWQSRLARLERFSISIFNINSESCQAA